MKANVEVELHRKTGAFERVHTGLTATGTYSVSAGLVHDLFAKLSFSYLSNL